MRMHLLRRHGKQARTLRTFGWGVIAQRRLPLEHECEGEGLVRRG